MVSNNRSYICRIVGILHDSLLKNSLFLIASIFMTSGLGFVFWIVATRLYSSSDVGLASTMVSSMNLLSVLCMLGLNFSLIKFLPSIKNARCLINTSFIIASLVTMIVTSIFLVGLNFWSPELIMLRENAIYFVLFVLFTIIWVITRLMSSIFISKKASNLVLIKESIFGAIKIPLLFVLISIGSFAIFISWGVGAAVGAATGLLFIFKLFPDYDFSTFVDMAIFREIFSYSFLNYLAWILNSLPGFLLPLLITNIMSPNFTAYFYISWTIASLLFAVPMQASQSLFAEGSYNNANLRGNIKKIGRFLSIALSAGIVFFVFWGTNILTLFGSEYAIEGLSILQIFIVSSIPYTINIIYIAIKRIEGDIRTVIYTNAIITSITILGGSMVMSDYGLFGIGVAWLIGNTLPACGICFIGITNKERA